MALGSLLGLIGTGIAKAYATSVANKKKTENKTTSNTVSTGNEHADYINQTNPGGMDAYVKLQNDRYNSALANNDVDLLNRLNADSKRVGYTLTGNQPVVNPMLDMVNPYQAQLEQNQAQYDALLKDYKNVLNASVNRGTANLEAQKGTINQGADEMARQAYILSRQNARGLPQQLAARGITGGATETAQLGLQTNYENNLNNINTNRFNALNQIDTAKTDLKNQGELSYAEQTLANNQAALNAYRNMLDKSVNFGQWQSEFNYGAGRDQVNDTRYNNEMATAQKQQEYNNILNRLQMGLISPNDAVMLGVSAQDVQAFVNRINQAADLELNNQQSLINKRNSTGTNNESGGDLQSGVIETATKYLGQGNREKAIATLASIMSNTEIKAFLEQNGIRTDDIDWGIEETPAPSGVNPSLPGTGGLNTTSMLVSYFKSKGYSDQQIANILNK